MKRKIIYINGVPYRNWYENLPAMSEKEEDELHKKISELRKGMVLFQMSRGNEIVSCWPGEDKSQEKYCVVCPMKCNCRIRQKYNHKRLKGGNTIEKYTR